MVLSLHKLSSTFLCSLEAMYHSIKKLIKTKYFGLEINIKKLWFDWQTISNPQCRTQFRKTRSVMKLQDVKHIEMFWLIIGIHRVN